MAFAFVVLVILINHFQHFATQVPCCFIFGDSLADSGNNNLLPTLAKCNFPPYGIDFPTGSTGRFCNGCTVYDRIGELFGFYKYLLPFAMAWKSDILKGINYASGSAGILEPTGTELSLILSLDLGDKDSAASYLNRCLYAVGIGSKDYIENYFMPIFSPTRLLFTPDQFAELLIQQYFTQIKTLNDLGARKVALFGLGEIGCTPNAIATRPRNGSICVENMNDAIYLFNNGLKSLVDKLNNQTTDANFIYINFFGITKDNASIQGFRVRDAPCCKVTSDATCIAFQTPCRNSTEYKYWDGFHPTEALNRVAAQRSDRALNSSDAYPFDINHLINL